jgi:predicted phage terminase large subunit-like protein
MIVDGGVILPDIDLVRRELAIRRAEKGKQDLHTFFRLFAWPVLEPGTPFMDNWHLHAICDHLQAVSAGQITRLLINIPFRMLKSRLVSQAWPAWEWIENSWLQYLSASFKQDLATRNAVDCRRIIESSVFQTCYGDRFRMTTDQNVKTRFENSSRGQYLATSTIEASPMGFGGNRIIIDDPLSTKQAQSELFREQVIEWWRGSGATRFNNPKTDAAVVVHQRLHQRDLSGHIIAEETEQGWEHLILPMRYDREHAKITSLGKLDPRTQDGELLFPERIDDESERMIRITLGAFHSAAQLDQRPINRGGVLFKTAMIQMIDEQELPTDIEWVRGWDFAATEENDGSSNAAYTAGGLLGRSYSTGKFYIGGMVRDRLSAGAVETLVSTTAYNDTADVQIDLPQDPGQAGKSQAQWYTQALAGYMVSASSESGDKTLRAQPLVSQVELGNVCMVIGKWNRPLLDEMDEFPNGKFKDQVDSLSRAFAKLTGVGGATNILLHMRQRAKELEADTKKRNQQRTA